VRPGKRNTASAVDVIWFTKAEKLKGIAEAVALSIASGRAVLLFSHFESTLSETTGALDSAGIEHQLLDHPLDPGSYVHGWFGPDEPGPGEKRVMVALSERVPVCAAPMTTGCSGGSLDILISGRYPIEDRDDLILSFAAACCVHNSVYFHSSLEDPMFRYFGSDRCTKLFAALGRGSTEPLTGAPITRAIRSAQAKVKKKYIGDQRVASPEAWFKYNVRR
jgi:hypothetical protein